MVLNEVRRAREATDHTITDLLFLNDIALVPLRYLDLCFPSPKP